MESENQKCEEIELSSGKKKFTRGKYKGKTYQVVRTEHPQYFLYLISQPIGTVYVYVSFIEYCMYFLTATKAIVVTPQLNLYEVMY